jgi:hypothetical protein
MQFMKKLMAFLRLLIFGKARRPSAGVYFGGGAGYTTVGHTPEKPAQTDFCLDLLRPRQSRTTTISKPAMARHHEPPKRISTFGDVSKQNQIIFCKDKHNGI